jgi:hypothetical protein
LFDLACSGYNLVDNGYCRFDHVRIPRKNMLAKFSFVTPVSIRIVCGRVAVPFQLKDK